jgi:AcrR family transcriptional regulator
VPGPAYTRLEVDERRRRLLALGAGLFARFSYDELTMARIAREAGISKALLYHYFPSKQAYFAATLEDKAAELAALTAPDPALPPEAQLERGLDAFLGWVEANADAYGKLVRSAAVIPEVREVVDRVRDATSDRILAGLADEAPPAALRTAVRAWVWFIDGAILDWVEHRDLTRAQLRALLLATLRGATGAATAR